MAKGAASTGDPDLAPVGRLGRREGRGGRDLSFRALRFALPEPETVQYHDARTTDSKRRGMIISYSHNFLFVHIGKTAGTNVAKGLEPYAHDADEYVVPRVLRKVGFSANYLGPYRWRRFRIHATASTAQRHLPPEVYDRLFKFAFVRNPWEWIVSQYRFMLRNPQHHRHETVRKLGSFPRYLQWEAGRRKRSQHGFILDRSGRCIVDFVGRFESLSDDFDAVCRRIGIDASIPGRNEGHSTDYRDSYDDASLELVAELFSRDIELFRYGMDGPLCSTEELNESLAKLGRS